RTAWWPLSRRFLADSPAAVPAANPKRDPRYGAQDIAFYRGWLAHYTADGAQPLHDTIHHDGWQGKNPKEYTTDPRVHGRFESAFVDLIQVTDADLTPLMTKPRTLADPFAAILAHLDDAATHVEDVYILDKSGALADKNNAQAAKLVRMQLAKAAALLRDLASTAWVESAAPAAGRVEAGANPISRTDPQYNPETGTAPPGPTVRRD